MAVIDTWHSIIKDKNMPALRDLLAEDAVFFSPVVHSPQRGRDLVMMYLTGADNVLNNGTFHYVKEVVGDRAAVLEFQCEVDGLTVNGVDIISWNDDQQITEFKVMVRPLKAINLLHQKMFEMLEQLKAAEG